MLEKLKPFSKRRFNALKAAAEERGYTVKSKWQPGITRIRLGDIVLTEALSAKPEKKSEVANDR